MEITYLEDDDEAPRTVPRATHSRGLPPPGGPRNPPLPGGATGASWWVCANEGTCSHSGYVATGPDAERLVTRIKWGRCKGCRGIGVDVEADGNSCEACGGKGSVPIKKWEEEPSVPCPYCHTDMMFMAKGAKPEGYPRMEIGTPEEAPATDEEKGRYVGFGRSRTIS